MDLLGLKYLEDLGFLEGLVGPDQLDPDSQLDLLDLDFPVVLLDLLVLVDPDL